MTASSKNVRFGRYCLTGALILLALTAAARVASVLYSETATNIRYSETVLPQVLYYVRQPLQMCAFGAGIAFSVRAVFQIGRKAGAFAFLIHAGVLLLDCISAITVDLIGGALNGALLQMALLLTGAQWLFLAILAFCACWIACQCVKKHKSPATAVLLGALIHMAGWLTLKAADVIQFMAEVGFYLYRQEIVVIVGEVLQIIVLNGGAVWISARIFYSLFSVLMRKR